MARGDVAYHVATGYPDNSMSIDIYVTIVISLNSGVVDSDGIDYCSISCTIHQQQYKLQFVEG